MDLFTAANGACRVVSCNFFLGKESCTVLPDAMAGLEWQDGVLVRQAAAPVDESGQAGASRRRNHTAPWWGRDFVDVIELRIVAGSHDDDPSPRQAPARSWAIAHS